MKTTVVALALVFMSGLTLSAQDSKNMKEPKSKEATMEKSDNQEMSVKQHAQTQTDRLAKQLDLTDDQKTKVYRQYYSAADKGNRLNNSDKTAAEKESMTKQYASDREKEFKTILSDEQYQKYLKVKDMKYDDVDRGVRKTATEERK